VGLGLDFGVEV